MNDPVVAAEVIPRSQRTRDAARALGHLGFRVLHVGTSISVEAPTGLWQSYFGVTFEKATKDVMPDFGGREVAYRKARTDQMRIPEELGDVIEGVEFVEPPEFFSNPS